MQARSLRFRAVAGGWVAAATVPAAAIALRPRPGVPTTVPTYVAETFPWLVPLSVLAGFVLAADGLLREREQETWSTLSLCGLSSAGYVLRRWLALLVPLLAASVVPVLLAAALAAATGGGGSWQGFAWPWLLRVVPAVALWSAIGLGFATAAGGTFAGLWLAVATAMVPLHVLNALLFRFRLHLDGPSLELVPLLRSIYRLQAALGESGGAYAPSFPVVASAAPPDLRVLAQQALGPRGTTLALAALGLAWAILLLRRTRPDQRPWTAREGHPLRSFIGLAARLRGQFAPDAGLAPVDRLAVAMAIGCLLVVGGAAIARDAHYVRAAKERLTVENAGWPPPTAPALRVTGARLSGRIDDDGSVRLRSTLDLRNGGETPLRELALMLDPALRLEALGAPGRALRWQRRHDRLRVTLAPPLAAGAVTNLEAVVSGRPRRTVFAIPGAYEYGGFLSFQRSFGMYLHTGFADRLVDLTPSFATRGISPTRVELPAPDLFPLPRYTALGLVAQDDFDGPLVPAEAVLPPVRVSVALQVPAHRWLADSCGDVAAGGRLAGGCRLPLPSYAVRGGPQVGERVRGLTEALLPGHRELATAKLGPVAELAATVREVWPEEDLLASTVLLEVPDEATFLPQGNLTALAHLYRTDGEVSLVAQGRMLMVPEVAIVAGRALPPGALAARIVGSRLLQRRPLALDQQTLLTALVESFAALRAGYGPPTGAVLPATLQGPGVYEVSLLAASPYDPQVWGARLPALLVDLGNRIGDDAVHRGLAAFLARRGGPPGTLEELVHDWESAGGVPLDDFYRQYLAGTALPVLGLAGVTFAPAERGWRVRGRVVNGGTGEAHCTVVLTSEAARSSLAVVVPGSGAAPIDFDTMSPPRAVLLDPEQRCHRYRPLVPAPVERVDYRGVSGG